LWGPRYRQRGTGFTVSGRTGEERQYSTVLPPLFRMYGKFFFFFSLQRFASMLSEVFLSFAPAVGLCVQHPVLFQLQLFLCLALFLFLGFWVFFFLQHSVLLQLPVRKARAHNKCP